MKPIKLKFKVNTVTERLEENYKEEGVVFDKVTVIGFTCTPQKARPKARLHSLNVKFDTEVELFTDDAEIARQFSLGQKVKFLIIPDDQQNH